MNCVKNRTVEYITVVVNAVICCNLCCSVIHTAVHTCEPVMLVSLKL